MCTIPSTIFPRAPCSDFVSPVDTVFTRVMRRAPHSWKTTLRTSTASTPRESTSSSGAANSRPRKRAPCLDELVSTRALSRSRLGTWFGTRADMDGSCTDRTVPFTRANRATCHSSALPLATRTAIAPTTAPPMTNVDDVSLRRSKTSPSSPPTGDTTRKGIIAANVVIPTHPEDSEASYTSHEVAIMNVHIAEPEHIPASHVLRKSVCFSDENCGRSVGLRTRLGCKLVCLRPVFGLNCCDYSIRATETFRERYGNEDSAEQLRGHLPSRAHLRQGRPGRRHAVHFRYDGPGL